VGLVQSYAGRTPPLGWLLCDGAAISRVTYAELFAVIGSDWGAGDGATTFNVPDLRSRSVVGAGQGAGLSNRALAAKGGEESHVLTAAELAAHAHSGTSAGQSANHTHTLTTGTQSANHTHKPNQGTGFAATGLGTYGPMPNGSPTVSGPATVTTANSVSHTHSGTSAGANVGHTHTFTSGNTGSNGAHNNMPPFAALNYIIRA
jgi:microcystin-dependent protein